MTERPILFSAPMVRALQAGTKTQTRRAVKARADRDMGPRCVLQPHELAGEVNGGNYRNAYCAPGDRLWVREAWRTSPMFNNQPPRDLPDFAPLRYEADNALRGAWAGYGMAHDGKLRPGMFMPRWASRITLEVTNVRVERLQDISEADARAEGCHGPEDDIASNLPDCPQCGGSGLYTAFNPATGGALPDTDCRMCDTSAKRYRLLWDRINGAGSWGANPWVWCVAFKVVAP